MKRLVLTRQDFEAVRFTEGIPEAFEHSVDIFLPPMSVFFWTFQPEEIEAPFRSDNASIGNQVVGEFAFGQMVIDDEGRPDSTYWGILGEFGMIDPILTGMDNENVDPGENWSDVRFAFVEDGVTALPFGAIVPLSAIRFGFRINS